MAHTNNNPELLPILARGKHRNPRRGACFMELASYLAGERWSDHPSCTHPLLAELARLVNDSTSDAARPALAPLIPSVIGLTSDDPRFDATVALRAATNAISIAPAPRQGCLAVGILASERVLARLDGRDGAELSAGSQEALAQVPEAERWARDFARHTRVNVRGFQRRGAPGMVRCAVDGIARGCVPDSDGALHQLLVETIADCEAWREPEPDRTVTIGSAEWNDACRISGRVTG